MFRNTFQAGYLSILYSLGSRPLQLWEGEDVEGVQLVRDEDLQSSVVEVVGENIADIYIACPSHPKKTLGIKLPYIVILVKNMNKYFSFEIEALDDKKLKRRFRASNYQTQARVKPYICTMPLRLSEGWNQVQLNIADLMRKAYGTTFVEISRVQVHANCRLRRIYFAEKPHAEEDLPPEFKLFLPSESRRAAVLG